MIHLQAHYHTILTFGTKYKSLYRNDYTIYKIHLIFTYSEFSWCAPLVKKLGP